MKLIPAQFVKPFVQSSENDLIDVETVDRHNMRFVASRPMTSSTCNRRTAYAVQSDTAPSTTKCTMKMCRLLSAEFKAAAIFPRSIAKAPIHNPQELCTFSSAILRDFHSIGVSRHRATHAVLIREGFPA